MPDRALDGLQAVECGDRVSATYAGKQIVELAERGVIRWGQAA